tara:strand:+ start:804 stop:1898 length:1095 start_codon:yes stop_codon:yes gene_type:complete
MASVTFENVTKRFDDTEVVKNLNLKIADKEFVVLVGPSGCGKSTTLRMLAGLEEVSAGHIFIGDQEVNDLPPRERDISMVFQSYALYPHKSVFENIAFSLRNRGLIDKEINSRVGRVAELLDIGELLDRRPRHLSGGQKQRVALGRSIVREPAVFLMDEPLSNLDAKLRVSTRAELVKLHKRLSTTFIYVTHDQVEALTMGSRIAVLKEGILEQIGNAETLYADPENIFVASFIGSPSMNFIHGECANKDGILIFQAQEMRLEITRKFKQTTPHGNLILGIRPEHIDLEFSQSTQSGGSQIAKITSLEPTGAETLVGFKLGNTEIIARIDSRKKVKLGEIVNVKIDLNHIHFFDPNTELNINRL